MTSSPALEAFCDWLDVTFSPTDCPYPEVNRLLLDAGAARVDVYCLARTPKPGESA